MQSTTDTTSLETVARSSCFCFAARFSLWRRQCTTIFLLHETHKALWTYHHGWSNIGRNRNTIRSPNL